MLFPFWVWVLIVAAVAVVLIQTLQTDQGMANGYTWPVLVLAGFIILLWFCFFSRHERHVRMELLLGACLLAGLFFLLFRVDGLTGNIIPILSWRFGPAPADKEPPAPASSGADAAVPLAKTTPFDFPQFLGPNRDLSVSGVKLERDWIKHPPKELWRNKIGAGWCGFAIVNGYAVTLEQRGDTELVTCYNLETGKLEWSHGHTARYDTWIAGVGPRSTPAIHQGKVYAVGATGVLFCLDGANGKPLWQKDLLQEFGLTPRQEYEQVMYGRAGSPLIVDDMVVVPAGGPADGPRWSLAAFHKDTGVLLWKGGDRNVSYSSPAYATLAGKPQIVLVNEDTISSHDPKSGEVCWQVKWPGVTSKDANVSQAVPLPPDRVFVSKGYGGGAMLFRIAKGDAQADRLAVGKLATEEIWRQPRHMKTKFTNVTIHEGHVYGLSDGILECLELDTGKRVWRDGRYGHGQILRVEDLLLVLSEEGDLFLVEASPKREDNVLGEIKALEGRTWNNLAMSGPHLLLRNGSEAVCYKLATPKE
ncbi:MAG: PQQ-like beta-propeller repeat protein [Gemmataceae bacterium]|nr:PQQ-like beta-propeller repeat protein [Gemmataceae bacterium]